MASHFADLHTPLRFRLQISFRLLKLLCEFVDILSVASRCITQFGNARLCSTDLLTQVCDLVERSFNTRNVSFANLIWINSGAFVHELFMACTPRVQLGGSRLQQRVFVGK